MAIPKQYVTSVGTTAVAIEGTQYPTWLLKNNGSVTMYIGDSAVTSGTGFPIEAGDVFTVDKPSHDSLRGKPVDRLWGRTASGTADVRVLIQTRTTVDMV